MICPHCGFENEEGQKTCSSCGAALEGIETPEQETPEVETPRRTSIWSWIAAGLFVALVAAALWIFKGPGLGQSDPLLYGVLSDTLIPFGQIGVLENGGSKATPLGESSNSLAIAPYSIRAGHTYLSSKGQLALIANGGLTGQGQLLLVDVKGGTANTAVESPLPLTVAGNFQSFSPDGEYFGYTSISADGSALNAVVVNSRAANVMVAENMILSQILPDGKHFLAYPLDALTGNPARLVSVAIPSGEQTVLFQSASTDVLAGADVVAPDGSIYFVMQRDAGIGIYRLGPDGGEPALIYTFQQPVSFFGVLSLMPDQKSLLVMDANADASGYALLNVNPEDGTATTLATNVFADFFSDAVFLRQMYGEMVVTFSPDGKHMAYLMQDAAGLGLYVSDLSGQPGTLIASGGASYSYAFSPDSQRLIYIQYAAAAEPTGSLNSADFSGKSAQLDENVTSFNFQKDKLVYFSAQVTDSPYTTLYQSGMEGQTKSELLAAQPGYWVFIKLPN
jgi:hypothetical protein